MFSLVGPYRGQAMILTKLPGGPHEVLWRGNPAFAEEALKATERGHTRGLLEVSRGWPSVLPSRSPIFVRDHMDLWRITERHPRVPFGDQVIYRTPCEFDAGLVLQAVRRAATMAAQRLT